MDTNKLSDVHDALPDSTQAECQRFLMDSNGDAEAAIHKLGNYLQWRKQYCNNDQLNHLDPWAYATLMAMQSSAAKKKGSKEKNKGGMSNSKASTCDNNLPCTVFVLQHEQIQQSSTFETNNTANDDTNTNYITKKYLHHLPARIDPKLADTSTYALALALFIDRVLDRKSTEKATLVIDVRAGYGWANISAIKLVPFIQSVIRMLCDLFPNRLEKCIVFPIPKAANVLWKASKAFVDKETANRICLVSGPASKKSKVPTKLGRYLDHELITKLEDKRTSCFTIGQATVANSK